jgi:serine/threonine-protein kinase
MAPEQLRGAGVTAASDIYALGLVLYELFTGKRPYEAKTLQHLIDLQESAQLTSMTSIATDVDPAVERVIRRCLDPDPLKRPPTPISVAATLPGGDPLAAALAAGETPSPELVANAGKVEGLPLRYSIPCLAVIVVCLFGTVAYAARHYAAMYDPGALAPDVLAHRAREIAASFGYPDRPADSLVWVENRGDLVEYLNRQPAPRPWSAWFAAESPLRGVYRESPAPLIARPDGNVNRADPPLDVPGMTLASVDGHGRLLAFYAAPRDAQRSAAPEDVFRAARLDIAQFREVPASFVPQHASDSIRAWEGVHPDLPFLPLTVRIASWRGQITQAEFLYPYQKPATGQPAPPLLSRARELAVYLLPILGTLFAALVARRNWKLGRTDRRGALRVAAARFLLGAVAWTGYTHPVPGHEMFDHFLGAAGELLIIAGMTWVVYLAIEPAIRARYPHAMITWNRLLAGRWLDAQVCGHVLIGAAVGAALWLGISLVETHGVHAGGNVWAIMGPRQWLGRQGLTGASALTFGLLLFAVMCFLRQLLRHEILAALATGALFTMNEGDVLQAANWQLMAAIFVCVFALLAFVLIRFGLVASITAIFFANGFSNIWLGGDWQAWFVPAGVASFLFLLGFAGVAFWKSMGDRELLGGEES